MADRLHADTHGAGPRLGLMHGFTQTRRCWGPFAQELARQFELVIVDAPGHGGSAGVVADVPIGASLLGWTVGQASYLGYSMGGRHALRLAVDKPDLVERLVLIGASPGIDEDRARHDRLARDVALAEHLEQVGVDQFLTEWLEQPLFATLPPAASFVEERRTNTSQGLAASLRTAGTGAQDPLWDKLASLEMPVLLLVGALDKRFTSVADRMREAIGVNATVHVIADAGHTVHLERPAETARVVADWLLS